MKKVIILSVLITLIAVACTKKVVPTTSGAETSPAKKTVVEKKSEADKRSEVIQPLEAKDPAPVVANKPSEEETGKNVFTAKCGKCHALKNVASFSFNQWEGILKTMVPRAKLTADEENQVVAYIKANSK